ncbi:zinc finger Y-chromosomal protein-like [Harmonia axyridis]|uniref:zinc finger Y-chromosomal protein-like n=1 Tax=Harmonia axyridis TaxID=115357 RepID=UPI001E2798D6|nr:zinc finger Y-chromosomal protein-like [Harmonia axyridis]
MSTNDQVDTIVVKDEKESDDSDVEIIENTPALIDVPEYIDPKSLVSLLNQPKEELPPIVDKIVKRLTNDEEFDRECDKFYQANLDMDVEVVSVDVAKVLSEPIKLPTPSIKLNLNGEINDIRTQRDLPGICDLCEDAIDHVELLLEHFKGNHHLKDGNYVCPFCDYTSPKHEVVMKHTTKVHKLSSEKLSCDQCEFETFRGDLFNRHSNKHMRDKTYSCEKCNYKTVNLSSFKMHLSYKHTKETEFKCSYCEFKSVSHASVKRHETCKHAKERALKCDQCHFTTTQLHSLKRHQGHCKNRNRRKFKHQCEECTFKTDDLSSLENHNLVNHPKKEILFCNICPFETTEEDELKEHAKEHLKSEPLDE